MQPPMKSLLTGDRLTGRCSGPVANGLGALMQSAARYPNVKSGQEFTGYS